MKNLYLLILFPLFSIASVFAQDIIVLNDKTSIKAKVIEITGSEVKYKKFDNQAGPVYSVSQSEIANIVYENGDVEIFEASKPRYGKECYIELPQCGLIVACLDLAKEIKWGEANNYAPDGWRLPTLKELQCMCKYQNILHLNHEDEYWSSTTRGSNDAYSVTMDDCEDEKNAMRRTRAVRYVRNF